MENNKITEMDFDFTRIAEKTGDDTDKYNKMKALLIEARYLLTAPHRTEEVDAWVDEFKEVIKQ